MYKSRFVQQSESGQKLLSEYSDECRAKASELVLLDELVEIDAQKFED